MCQDEEKREICMGELRALVLPRARSRTDSIENYVGKPQGDFIVSFHRGCNKGNNRMTNITRERSL